MKKTNFKLITMVLLMTGFSMMAEAQTKYWLGTKDGDKLVFNVEVPADAATVIMHKTKAPDGGADTTPHYKTFTKDGIVLHENEIAWETPKLGQGSLTWVTEGGVGEEWKNCNPKNPLWNNFAEALKELSTPYGEGSGWSQAKVVIAESRGSNAPGLQINVNNNSGEGGAGPAVNQTVNAPAAAPAPGSKRCANVTTPLTDAEIDAILRIHNEQRAEVGTAPLKWNCDLAAFGQNWANKDEWKHSTDADREKIIPGNFAGENLSAEANPTSPIAQMLQGWIDEKQFWNNSAKTCATGKVCGHYTAMVWKTTTSVGCGIIRNGSVMGDEWKGQSTYLVCNYYPGGNNGDEAF